MMFPSFHLLALTIAIVVSGQENNNEVNNQGIGLQQEYSAESSSNSLSSITTTTTTNNNHNFLRRELQTLPSCRATYAKNTYVCGGVAGVTTDVCQGSTATCDGLRYDCTCGGIAETSCAYCQIRTANSIMCQVSGTASTFVDLNYQATTCACEYIGYGQVNQTCYNPAAMPIPFHPPTVPAPQPVETPAPIDYTVPPPMPTPAPIMFSPFTFAQMSCQALNPYTPILEANGICSSLPAYPCTCSGSSETSCTYCQIRAFESIRCMVTGSTETFIDPVGDVATCSCEYKGNGQVQSYCYRGEPPDIPTVSTPAPTVVTSPRVPDWPTPTLPIETGGPQPSQYATEAPVTVIPPPVYVAPPVQQGQVVNDYSTKKSKKRRLSRNAH